MDDKEDERRESNGDVRGHCVEWRKEEGRDHREHIEAKPPADRRLPPLRLNLEFGLRLALLFRSGLEHHSGAINAARRDDVLPEGHTVAEDGRRAEKREGRDGRAGVEHDAIEHTRAVLDEHLPQGQVGLVVSSW